MADQKSADRVQEEHLRVLGSKLGTVYHALYNEVTWLHAKWKQYRVLFGESPERVQLLNSVAGFFFRVIQDVLWEDVVLHVARLTDPPQSMGKDNLTLLRLPPLIDNARLSQNINSLVKTAKEEAFFARTWRHRHLAHRDLKLAVDAGAEQLPGISRENMEGALAAIRAVLNRVQGHYWDSEVAFTHFSAPGDAETLVYYLKAGAKAETRRRERLSQGCPLLEDLEA